MNSIDVIVPCYGYAHYLEECVRSVTSERGLAVRVIIIDDASPDSTHEVARRLARQDSRIVFRKHTENLGHITTYNEGIDWLEADYMLLLSADDYLLPGALCRAVDFLEAHPNVGFVYGMAVLTPESGLTAPPAGSTPASDTWNLKTGLEFINIVAASGTINPVPTPTAIVRTHLLKQLGGYRPELPHSGDMEMWLRLAVHGDVGEFNGYLAVWRRHESNMQTGYYRKDYGLEDLKQRCAAIDWVFEEFGESIPEAEKLHRRLRAPLAIDGLKIASWAMNDGCQEIVSQLIEFALSADPECRRSRHWKILEFKRFYGARLWHSLYTTASRVLGRSRV